MLKNAYNEKELQSRLADDDELAFRAIFDQYRNKIFSIACRVVKDEAMAEDTVQEVFIKLWVSRKKLGDVDNLNAYINTITRNHLFNQLRKLAHAEAFTTEVLYTGKQQADLATLEGLGFSELNSCVADVVNKLPPRQKEVFRLGKEEGMKYDEIASLLQISKETVKTHMSEALHFVRKSLQQKGHIITRVVLFISLNSILSFF